MKLSIFTTITNPQQRGDNCIDSFACYQELADEVIVMNGNPTHNYEIEGSDKFKFVAKEWPQEFSWVFIGQQFTRGYEACTGDWVIHMDLDFIFHESDFGKIRQALRDYPNSPAVSFYKWQFVLPDRYNLKSRLMLAVNKKKFGDRITFTGGGDLCQPQLDGQDIDINEMPQAGVPFYNYEKLSKTHAQIKDDVERMDRAYETFFGSKLYSTDSYDAMAGWLRMARGRFNKPQRHIKLDEHPNFIRETIKNLKPDQWGYSGFGLLEESDYVKSSNSSR